MSQHPGEPRPVTGAVGTEALAGLDDLPVADHVSRFEAVDRALRAQLSGGAHATDSTQDRPSDGTAAGGDRA